MGTLHNMKTFRSDENQKEKKTQTTQSVNTKHTVKKKKKKIYSAKAKKDTGKTLYVLDEPTTGLHFEDIRVLLGVLNKLVDKGNTIIVIEHNLDVIKCADYLIDMGPEGGRNGGQILFTGTPEEMVKAKTKSYTAPFLKDELKSDKK